MTAREDQRSKAIDSSAPFGGTDDHDDVDPFADRPAGEQLLDAVRAWLSRFVITISAGDLDVLAVWAVHTHVAKETYTTPRLLLDSPMPGSGKTTCLEHLQRLCLDAVQIATLSSPALLTRMLDKRLRTVLIDEADRSLDPSRDGVQDLIAVLNSGYKVGSTRPVLVPGQGGQWEDKEMPTFAPVAMAGNNPKLPDDTQRRVIRVLLWPDLDGAAEESDWELIDDEARELADRIAAWAEQVRAQIRTTRPPLPPGIVGSYREKWSPLRRVAELAGGRWPAAIDALATQDKEQHEMDRQDGLVTERPAVLLLKHLNDVWPRGETFVPTTRLLSLLTSAHPDTWGTEGPFGKALTAQRFGRMLAQSYRVNSTRPEHAGPRGYTAAGLSRAWGRMNLPLPIHPVDPAQPAQPAQPGPAQPVQPVRPVPPEGGTGPDTDTAEPTDPGQQKGEAGIYSLPRWNEPDHADPREDLRPVPEGDPLPAFSCQRCPAQVDRPAGMCQICAEAARRKAQAEYAAGGGPDAA